MKKIFVWLAVGVVALVSLSYIFSWYLYNGREDGMEVSTKGIEIAPIEHASFALGWDETVIYNDPVGAELFAGMPPAHIVLVSDIHGDHLSAETLAAVIGNATLIVPQAVKDELPAELAARAKVLANGETTTEEGISITAIPMYNLPGDSAKFHAKGRGNGYLLERGGVRVYIAGDTAGIPEMRALTNIDIALVPMNLPYTMSVDEAAEAVLAFKPKKVYPYHYRGTDGLADVARFKQLVEMGSSDIQVILAEWYPKRVVQ